MRRPGFLPLPGIGITDPRFYEGQRYSDRARFAQPITSAAGAAIEDPTGFVDPQIGMSEERPAFGESAPEPKFEAYGPHDPSPFRLGR